MALPLLLIRLGSGIVGVGKATITDTARDVAAIEDEARDTGTITDTARDTATISDDP